MVDGSGMRERLLEAAIDVLADDGLAGFTHRRIEDRAGAAHGSTTYHFGNREKLYAAALERVLEIEATLAGEALAEVFGDRFVGDSMLGAPLDWSVDWTGPEGLAAMRALAAAMLEKFRESRRTMLARFEIYLDAARTPGGRTQLTTARHAIYAAQAQQARALGFPDPELYARLLPALVDGLLVHDLAVPDEVIRARGADGLVLLSVALFAADPGRRR